jgi:rSAM/selenodomain-associated transferase 2
MKFSFSVIIPVLSESSIIAAALEDLIRIGGGQNLELFVVDGSPRASTIKMVKNDGVQTLRSATGRGTQMNRGAKAAKGDVLLFLHADTRLPERAFELMAGALRNDATVAGAFDLGIDARGVAYRMIEYAVALRTRLTRVPYGDQAIFIRRDFFNSIGGFSEIPLMEDIEIMRRIRKKGGRIAIIPQKVSTSHRRWAARGVVGCTLSNWKCRSLYFLGADPHRLAEKYRSRSKF